MKKILYFCPTDWRWIKQRPQFLAEELNKYYSLVGVYPWRNNRKGLQSKSGVIRLYPYFSIPSFNHKIRGIQKLNHIINLIQIWIIFLLEKPDVLWLSMPFQIDLLPSHNNCQIIYDCMDDYPAICPATNNSNNIEDQERRIVNKACVIFCSSEHLVKLISNRYEIDDRKIYLIRNGYSTSMTRPMPNKNNPQEIFKLGYFGTIGRWFDFDIVLSSLCSCSFLEFHLFGPTEKGMSIPKHERLFYHGVLENEEIPENVINIDVLTMPFVLNDIVLSVDPVKLYEYIHLMRNIICVKYPEIERFGNFVHFYNTKDEFICLINKLYKNNNLKYTETDANIFLMDNNWSIRAESVSKILNKIFKGE